MSRKNHKIINGRLLQTDKKFSSLKRKQIEKISEWFYEAYRQCYVTSGKIPGKKEDEEILSYVFSKINEAGIWIPSGEVHAYYRNKKNKLLKRLKKEVFKEDREQG